jgi:hypothetical protein
MSELAEATPVTGDAPPPDRSGLRLGLLVGALVVALVAGFGLGRLTGTGTGTGDPAAGAAADPAANHTHAPGVAPHQHGGATGGTASAGAEVGGLTTSAGGYTLVPAATSFTAGRAADFRFTVQGPDRTPMTTFAIVHEKPLHLIVARRDLSGFQHLHPTMAPDGTWSVPLTLPEPGVWRAFADFAVRDAAGQDLPATLGVDLTAAGAYTPHVLPAPARTAVVDGLTVGYEGTPTVGATQPLQFRVTQAGAPAALQPYLGSYGHLVVLREGDLAYLHTHPDLELSGGTVKFWLAAPSPGRYRMFFDFQVGGVVRTAAFTVDVA